MARQKADGYFDTLRAMTDCACRAAVKLDALIRDYTDVNVKAEEIHDIEHECDGLLHGIVARLGDSFITPIDREDLTDLANVLDTVVDSIEEVAMDLDMLCIEKMHPDALPMSKIAVDICNATHKAVCEFENYKHSKDLLGLIIEINRFEQEADRIYKANIKRLILNDSLSAKDLIRWMTIFNTLETVSDSCENAADVMEALICKNK